MSKTFRCPVDDVVFDTDKSDRMPTIEGHPDCPGPECAKKFANYPVTGKVQPTTTAAVRPAAAAAAPSVLEPAPTGQGW